MSNRKERRATKKVAKIAPTPAETKPFPLGPSGQHCRMCRFWAVSPGEDRDTLDVAACVRFPPAVVPQYAQTPMGAMPTGQSSSQFPPMRWFGWCGEFFE